MKCKICGAELKAATMGYEEKTRRKKKKWLIATTIALALGSVGCVNQGDAAPGTTQEDPVDELETIYVLASVTEYMADGSRGSHRVEYTYDEKGNLMTKEEDNGKRTPIITDDPLLGELIIGYEREAFDGQIDYIDAYTYNESGHIINHSVTRFGYDDDGKWVGVPMEDQSDINPVYHYGENGRIESVHIQKSIDYEYRYDNNGNLIGVGYNPQPDDSDSFVYVVQYSYDEENRLTEEHYYSHLGDVEYRYTYDGGRLDEMKTKYEHDQNMVLVSECGFEYNKNGNLIARKVYGANGNLEESTVCEYDDGRLISVIYRDPEGNDWGELKLLYEEDRKKGIYYAADGEKIEEYIYDDNGNLTRVIEAGGSYVELEYKAIRVTKTEAQRYKQIMIRKARIGVDGAEEYYRPSYDARAEFVSMIPYPVSDLYEIDILHCTWSHRS